MAYKRELIAKTKNLFDWSGKLREYYDTANCTIVEILTNGAILQGNIGSPPGNASYDNGWFRPGNDGGYGTAVTLSANDVVTISADYEILERNYASPTTVGVHLYGSDNLSGQRTSIETGVLYRIKGTYTIAKDGQYYPVFTLNSSKVKITNIQLEKNSTATDYVPYGYFSSYKKLLKVSDVCQLLDKSKYPATNTTHGITFTNNGDGTIITNGETSDIRASYFLNTVPATEGHIYLLTGVAGSTSKFFLNSFFATSTSWLKDNICRGGQDGIIFPYVSGATIIRTQIAVEPNATADNLIFKPQLFDLTEMYGAGNEPTTVAEFKQKFPNELYDYSPRCWVKSYKTGLIAETKNLLDYNKFNMIGKANYTINSFTGTIIRPQKTSFNNSLFYPAEGLATTLPSVDNLLQLQGTYTFSFAQSTTVVQIRIYNSDGTVDKSISSQAVTLTAKTKTLTFDTLTYVDLKIENNQPCRIIGLQVEKGTTATDYVPYGYL